MSDASNSQWNGISLEVILIVKSSYQLRMDSEAKVVQVGQICQMYVSEFLQCKFSESMVLLEGAEVDRSHIPAMRALPTVLSTVQFQLHFLSTFQSIMLYSHCGSSSSSFSHCSGSIGTQELPIRKSKLDTPHLEQLAVAYVSASHSAWAGFDRSPISVCDWIPQCN